MDPWVAARLDSANSAYEAEFFNKCAKCAKDFIQAGLQVIDFYSCYFDRCNDLLEAWAPVASAAEGNSLYAGGNEGVDRSAPERSIHPMTSTEMWTLATFVSQILAGTPGARKVEPRRAEDEKGAEMINELLQWNDDQQPTYLQIFLWVLDALVSNRGVMYDHWEELYKTTLEKVDRKAEERPEGDESEPPPEKQRHTRWRKIKESVGGFNKVEIINPIDFICDPMLPMIRFQKGRFAGHRVQIPWIELDRRSKLPVDSYDYVLPKTVEKLKTRPSAGGAWTSNTGSGTLSGAVRSRSFYERQRRGNPVGFIGATDAVNKEDGGIVECFCLTIRAAPKSYDIYPDDDEAELIEFLIGPDSNLLSVNVKSNLHDMFCYAVGEGRPNAHYQYSSSWALMISPIQAYVDFLKNKHMEVQSRGTGNLFIYDPAAIDAEMLTDPKKVCQCIPLTEQGQAMGMDKAIKQVPIVDTTSNFVEEMLTWIGQAEATTGAHAYMQGQQQSDQKDVTATEFTGIQQMGTGRVATIARCLAQMALQPQTVRFVMNFQQFMPDEQQIRITGDASGEYDPDASLEKYVTIRRDKDAWKDELAPEKDEDGNPIIGDDGKPKMVADKRSMLPDIQGDFDVTPQDTAMPGTDARTVAALTKIIEASDNPSLQQLGIFDPTIPGAIDLKKVFFEAIKKSGVFVRNLIISREKAKENLMAKMQASGQGVPPQPPTAPPAQPGDPNAQPAPTAPESAPPELSAPQTPGNVAPEPPPVTQ